MKKMTENERRLTKEIHRLVSENLRLRGEISSLEVDILFLKRDIESLNKANDKNAIYREVLKMVHKDECEDLSDLSEDDFAMYSVEEIGFETSYESVSSLLFLARYHCESYEDRQGYLPIDTVSKAIKYLTENGFKVTEV